MNTNNNGLQSVLQRYLRALLLDSNRSEEDDDNQDDFMEDDANDDDSDEVSDTEQVAAANRRPKTFNDYINERKQNLNQSDLASEIRKSCLMNGVDQHSPEQARFHPVANMNHKSFNMLAQLNERRYRHHCLLPTEKTAITSVLVPNEIEGIVYRAQSQMFCGQFSASGDIFMSACQDHTIRLFDFDHIQHCSSIGKQAKPFKTIHARDIGWSVLDVDYSPDSKFIIYSSWSQFVHLAAVDTVSDYHEGLDLDPPEGRFCAFSVKFSPDSREIVAGANDCCLYLYDLETKRRTISVSAHDNDINTVCFGDESGNLIFSGSDDGYCKAWDRRLMSNGGHVDPVGVFVGHSAGITCVSPKGDGRYMISNSKDQSLKLWDMRMLRDYGGNVPHISNRSDSWDYRFDLMARVKHRASPHDTSLMTYTGHQVVQTLIRCYFSPRETTGQRYIYTGSYDQKVYIYDLLTGEIVQTLKGHRSIVRDVSWHPRSSDIISSSWDGLALHWNYSTSDLSQESDETRSEIHRIDDGSSDEDYEEDEDDNEDLDDGLNVMRFVGSNGESYTFQIGLSDLEDAEYEEVEEDDDDDDDDDMDPRDVFIFDGNDNDDEDFDNED